MSRYIDGPPLEVNVVISSEFPSHEKPLPSMAYNKQKNVLKIHPIHLTTSLPLDYSQFIAQHDFVLHAYLKLDEFIAMQDSVAFLMDKNNIRGTVLNVYAKSNTYVEAIDGWMEKILENGKIGEGIQLRKNEVLFDSQAVAGYGIKL